MQGWMFGFRCSRYHGWQNWQPSYLPKWILLSGMPVVGSTSARLGKVTLIRDRYTPFPIATRHTLQWLKAELFSWESCHTSITTRHTVIKTKLFSWESCLCAKSCKQCIQRRRCCWERMADVDMPSLESRRSRVRPSLWPSGFKEIHISSPLTCGDRL